MLGLDARAIVAAMANHLGGQNRTNEKLIAFPVRQEASAHCDIPKGCFKSADSVSALVANPDPNQAIALRLCERVKIILCDGANLFLVHKFFYQPIPEESSWFYLQPAISS